jgi:methylmalonyl-CoA mutase N-terminal domain/subunit
MDPPEGEGTFTNISGFDIHPLYGPEDVAGFDYDKDLGMPGEYPYVRGVHRTMYRGRPWTIRQLGSLSSPQLANQRIRQLITMGATGVSICLDMPTIMGRDSDDPLCKGEVGSCGGVAIDSMEDVRNILEGIDLNQISINFVTNAQSAAVLAMFCAVAEEQGIPLSRLMGTLQNDILKEYQAQKSFYFPPRPSMRLIMDTIEYCSRHMPKFNPISISGYHLGSAGATPIQELAFMLANGFCYVEEGMKRGMPVDSFAPRLSFFFKAHNDFFENIAKFRAARGIWAKTMREKYGAKNPRSWMFRLHTQTSGSSLTAQQPENNIIRTTIQALAAVLAGTQSLHTNAFDEAFAIPSERSEKLALRTQQIILHESGVINTVDPLGGSYYVESLTQQMTFECQKYFDTIDKLGGVIPAIEKGFFQKEIADSAYRYQREIDHKERIIVGVNEYIDDDRYQIELRAQDPDFERRKIEELQILRQKRDGRQTAACIDAIRKAAGGTDNVMPPLIAAAKARVTLGEMIGAFRDVFGEYRDMKIY